MCGSSKRRHERNGFDKPLSISPSTTAACFKSDVRLEGHVDGETVWEAVPHKRRAWAAEKDRRPQVSNRRLLDGLANRLTKIVSEARNAARLIFRSAERYGESESTLTRFLVLAIYILRRLSHRCYGSVQIDLKVARRRA